MVNEYFVHAVVVPDSGQVPVYAAVTAQCVCAAEHSDCSVPEC